MNSYRPLFQGTYYTACIAVSDNSELYKKEDSVYYGYHRVSGSYGFWLFGSAYNASPEVVMVTTPTNCPNDPGTWIFYQGVMHYIVL